MNTQHPGGSVCSDKRGETHDLSIDEREAAQTAISHCPALRTHLKQAVNQLYLFDRVMVLAQADYLISIDADELADIRLRVEERRSELEDLLERVKYLPDRLKVGLDDDDGLGDLSFLEDV